ncbi:hypothetical protein Hanom_Chr11g01037401 [Helianthus anomalus]
MLGTVLQVLCCFVMPDSSTRTESGSLYGPRAVSQLHHLQCPMHQDDSYSISFKN